MLDFLKNSYLKQKILIRDEKEIKTITLQKLLKIAKKTGIKNEQKRVN